MRLLLVSLLIIGPVLAQSDLPLVKRSDIEYIGSFALPQGDYGESRFGFSGRAVTVYTEPDGTKTLFMEGHDWNSGTVGQVQIPDELVKSQDWDELPVADVLQDFHEISDGKAATLGTDSYVSIFGMLPYNARLIVAAASWYDAPCQQDASHGVSSLDLSDPDDFSGFKKINAVANARSLGGYMTIIPSEWRASFGGPALTGNSALSIISCISSGPAATVFNPDDVGVTDPIPGTTVVYYTLDNYLIVGNKTDENTWTFGSSVKGIAFPQGTRSVLFFGVQTLADGYCYGPGTDDPELHKVDTEGGTWCYDLCSSYKGGHGYPYYHYVWAYDANDLLKAKSGELEPWEVKPYAEWQLDDLDTSGCAGMRGAGYDPETGRMYVTQSYGEDPRVDVFQINTTRIAQCAGVSECTDNDDCCPAACSFGDDNDCCRPDDSDCDGCIEDSELMSLIALWKKGERPISNLMQSITSWKRC
jgi:hypothetical protein